MSKTKRKKIDNQRIKKTWISKKILPLSVIGGTLLVLAMIFMMNMPEKEIILNFSKDMESWQTSAGTKVRLGDDSVQLTRGREDFFINIPNLYLDADWYDVCVVEMKLPIASDQGHLLFLSPYNQKYNFNFRFDFDGGKANRQNKIWINLRKHGAWQGIIPGVLIIPATNSGSASLKSIKFIQSKPFTKLRAWWSDFSYYYDPKLGTCFAMASPFFIKTSFNLLFMPFLWGLLALTIIISSGVMFFHMDERISKVAIAIFFLVLIVLWGLLDLRNNIYYLKAIRRDASLYWGKSLQVKKGIVTGSPDFINFMKFCDEAIPLDGQIFNFVSSDIPGTPRQALSDTQFYFNLRPRINFESTKRVPKPFYVVYGSQKKEELRGLKLFKKYHENAYILTK
jgi:hypothetical protein